MRRTLTTVVITTIINQVGTKLQQELKQTRAFSGIEEEVILNVARTAEYFLSRLADVLKSAELTPTQYNALRILRGAGANGLTCGDISERMVTKDSDITRLLDRLERRGLVRRQRPENNRRIVVTGITSDGLRLLADLDGPLQEAQQKLLAHIGKQRLTDLNEMLEACRDDK